MGEYESEWDGAGESGLFDMMSPEEQAHVLAELATDPVGSDVLNPLWSQIHTVQGAIDRLQMGSLRFAGTDAGTVRGMNLNLAGLGVTRVWKIAERLQEEARVSIEQKLITAGPEAIQMAARHTDGIRRIADNIMSRGDHRDALKEARQNLSAAASGVRSVVTGEGRGSANHEMGLIMEGDRIGMVQDALEKGNKAVRALQGGIKRVSQGQHGVGSEGCLEALPARTAGSRQSLQSLQDPIDELKSRVFMNFGDLVGELIGRFATIALYKK